MQSIKLILSRIIEFWDSKPITPYLKAAIDDKVTNYYQPLSSLEYE